MTDRVQIIKPDSYPSRKDLTGHQTRNMPERWKGQRLKFVAKTIAGQSPPSEIVGEFTGSCPFLQGNAEFGAIFPSPILSCESPNKSAEPGDILLSVRAPVGAINIADQSYGIGRGLCAIRAKPGIYQKFLYQSLTTTKETLKRASTGSTYDAVSIGDVGNIPTPVPPLAEQAAIVRYLDHADELISRYISAKERLITLLEEQRQAVIHQAVTRGLDPNIPLKPSGIPWIGDAPNHWAVRRLRTLVDISTGGKDTINKVEDGKYPFYVRSQTVEKINTWSFDGEAVLTAGDGVGVGKVFHYIEGKFDYHQRVYKFSRFTELAGKFFYHYFKAMLRFETSQGTAKSTVDSLRLPMLQNFPVLVPPPNEQIILIQALDRSTANTDDAIELTKRQIDLVDEYRTRLIADVVTGQIDVRNTPVELPD